MTIMRTGAVVYHGSIAALRAKAPEQAHEIRTTDDDRVALLAIARGLEVNRLEGGLAVRGPQPEIDALVTEIVADGIALRELARRETPLEALFFMLTEPDTTEPAPELSTTGANR